MKGYYKLKNASKWSKYATIEKSAHPLYNKCTLFKRDDYGLVIVQQHFNKELKMSWWGPVDASLADDIFEHEGFDEFFVKHARKEEAGLYPTFEVRKVMYALNMKPLKKQFFEKGFDRK